MHNCLACKYSSDWQKPVSVTTASKVQFSFKCTNSNEVDCYGIPCKINHMWFELPTFDVWVDGSNSIPINGCPNFKRDFNCNPIL